MIQGNVPGVPFPVPQSGLEVLWNHMIRFQGVQSYYKYDSYYVDANGKPVLAATADNWFEYPMFMEHYKKRNYGTTDLRYAYLRIDYRAPPRRAGEILLVHEPGADYTAGKGRDAWQYLTGQRRVRKAPSVSFDTPNPSTAGTSTYDDSYMYNGSPERFEWTLVGKKEMLIPYNCNTFVFEKKALDLLDKHFFKPEFVRWEKHRVWIVEGKLKRRQPPHLRQAPLLHRRGQLDRAARRPVGRTGRSVADAADVPLHPVGHPGAGQHGPWRV